MRTSAVANRSALTSTRPAPTITDASPARPKSYATQVYRTGRPPSIIHSDGLTGALCLDKPAEVASYGDVWSATEKKALSEAHSRKLIASIASIAGEQT
ncbi:Scr1 family TA system antitoxin-like transcriptional regulator [Micromonospora sp. RTGN7]|uniref:Scr1 family TA system antitoxin-like transcriptional regulator n=1 Tax=Micromonospora sp. RTGN7 TaxID=3016526 RepID=UPI0039B6FA54